MHSSPGRRSSHQYEINNSIAKIRCRRLVFQALSFSPASGAAVKLFLLKAVSVQVVSRQPLLTIGGVVPVDPPEWLPPAPPLTPKLDEPRDFDFARTAPGRPEVE